MKTVGADDRSLINAKWQAPSNVHAMVTTRLGGVSCGAYRSFNLAQHVGDQLESVIQNRVLLTAKLAADIKCCWLDQQHTNRCIEWYDSLKLSQADACFTQKSNQACIVMTADCLPILISNQQGNWVAACHAGWRGLANGIVQNTIGQYTRDPRELIAWIGPAISQQHFEVGEEVKAEFCAIDVAYQKFFTPSQISKFQFDLIGLAKQILFDSGVRVYGGDYCSYGQAEMFYSYRRDGQTGRMASIIWFE